MSKKKLRTVLVDDDNLQLEVMSDFVKKTSFLDMEATFHKPLLALDHIIISNPDLLPRY